MIRRITAMNPPRRRRTRLTAEHALLLGALVLFVAGSVWVARTPRAAGSAETGSWLGAFPGLGLPLVHATLFR